MKKNEKMKTVVFGYNKKSVDLFLKRLHRMQEEELQELRKKVAKARNEQEKLLLEIELYEEVAHPEVAPKLVVATNQHLQEDLAGSQSQIDTLSETIPKLISMSENNLDPNSSRSNIIPIFEKVKQSEAELTKELHDDEHSAEQSASKVQLRTGIEEHKPAVSSRQKQRIENLFFFDPNAEPILDEQSIESIVDSYSLPPKNKKPAKGANDSDFWGDLGKYMEDHYEIPEFIAESAAGTEIVANEVDLYGPALQDTLHNEHTTSSEAVEHAQTEPKRSGATAADESSMTYEHAQASQEERDSNHTDPEIQALKNRYIVGKLSGEDILDRQGKVIVAKNSVITEAAMLLAEREGKLVELILNMIIPGMEE